MTVSVHDPTPPTGGDSSKTVPHPANPGHTPVPPPLVVPNRFPCWSKTSPPPCGSPPSVPPVNAYSTLSVQFSPSAAGGVSLNTVPCPQHVTDPPKSVVPYRFPWLSAIRFEVGLAASVPPGKE